MTYCFAWTAEDTFNKLIYKPNGRNIFALSMGIPTILFPYVSYTEALKWSQYPAFASNVPELLRWLEILVERTEVNASACSSSRCFSHTLSNHLQAREELSRLGLEFAQQLSLDNVCRYNLHTIASTVLAWITIVSIWSIKNLGLAPSYCTLRWLPGFSTVASRFLPQPKHIHLLYPPQETKGEA